MSAPCTTAASVGPAACCWFPTLHGHSKRHTALTSLLASHTHYSRRREVSVASHRRATVSSEANDGLCFVRVPLGLHCCVFGHLRVCLLCRVQRDARWTECAPDERCASAPPVCGADGSTFDALPRSFGLGGSAGPASTVEERPEGERPGSIAPSKAAGRAEEFAPPSVRGSNQRIFAIMPTVRSVPVDAYSET